MIAKINLANPNANANRYEKIVPQSMAELLSVEKAEQEAKKSPAAKAQKLLFPALISTFVVASAAKTKGTPVQKLTVGAIGALSYLLLGKSFDIAEKVSNKVIPEDKKGGLLSIIGSIGGGIALYGASTSLASKGGKRLASKLSAKNGEKIINAAEKINSSKTLNAIMANIAKPFKAFSNQFPKAAGFISRNYVTMGIVGFFAASMALSAKIRNDKIKTYEESMATFEAQKNPSKENYEDLAEVIPTAEDIERGTKMRSAIEIPHADQRVQGMC